MLKRKTVLIMITVSLLLAGCGSSVPYGTAAESTPWGAAETSASSSEGSTPTPSPTPTAAPTPSKTPSPTPSPTPEVIHAPEPDNAQLSLMTAWLNALFQEQTYRNGSADYTVRAVSGTSLTTANLVTMVKEYCNYSEKTGDKRITDCQEDGFTGKSVSKKDAPVILSELFGEAPEKTDALLGEFPIVDNSYFVDLDGFREEALPFFFEITSHSIREDKELTVSGQMYCTDYKLFADHTSHDITSFDAVFSLGAAKAPMPYRFEKLTLEQPLSDVLPELISGQGTYFTTQELKFRTVPSYQGDFNGTVPADSPVNVLDFGSAGFYHIRYEGKDGYLPGSCLLPGEFAVGPQPSNTLTIMRDTGLFDWPGMGADEILLALPKGTQVFYYCDAENGTFFAECNGVKGFVPAAALNEYDAWQKAYYDYLTANYSGTAFGTTFALAYLDGDAIPELLVGYNGNGRYEKVSIYHYRQGTVAYLGSSGSYSTLYWVDHGNLFSNEDSTGATETTWYLLSIAGDHLEVQYAFELDYYWEVYYWQDSSGIRHESTETEILQMYDSVFSSRGTKRTPNIFMDEPGFYCSAQDLQLILTNPAAVTL